MNRFERVTEILDEAIGGPNASIRSHGPFWRRLTRDQFVGEVVQGRPLLVVGKGAESNLVKALKGVAPFDGTLIRRMPAGRPPVSTEGIAFIERWIDDGCPEDQIPEEPVFAWRPTNAPMADQDRGKRYDDIWFATPQLGWGVNSDGKILRTDDGGDTWVQQFHDVETYFRCLGFASETRGWAGTLSGSARLLETHDGKTWTAVPSLPEGAPRMICGLTVVDDSVVYASGTNYPFPFLDNPPPAVVKTVDGGTTWTAIDMTAEASLLVDIHFTTPNRGWVVGGKADATVPEGAEGRDNVKPVVLFTEDGGQTWVDRVAGMKDEFPFGEWGWKIQFLDENIGYVSLENFDDGAILKTSDGGTTWKRLPIDDEQQNANLEGVGFVDENHGWVGGWGSPAFVGGQSSATTDGGKTWTDANEIGKFINRFRFLGSPVAVGYAAGATVYKYTKEPAPTGAPLAAAREAPAARFLEADARTGDDRIVRIPVTVPENAGRLVVNVWERFGRLVAQPLDETSPSAGSRVIEWDASELSGNFIVRITVDDESDSEIVMVTPR